MDRVYHVIFVFMLIAVYLVLIHPDTLVVAQQPNNDAAIADLQRFIFQRLTYLSTTGYVSILLIWLFSSFFVHQPLHNNTNAYGLIDGSLCIQV